MGSDTVTLPDVKTTDSTVRSDYQSWIKDLISTYSIDGLRIDTCLEVETDFFSGFRSAAGVYSVCETFNGDVAECEPYQQVVDGVLNYPLYYPILDAFKSTSGDISRAVNGVNTVKDGFSDSTLLGTFLENHDNPRFPSYTSDIALAQNAAAFAMLADGIPIVYYGQEQHFSGSSTPGNRETLWSSGYSTTSTMYKFIALVNALRNHAIFVDSAYLTYKSWPIYSDTTTIATRKGSDGEALISVFSNKGSSGASYTQSIPNTGYSSGDTIVDVVACKTMTAASDGSVTVSMGAGAVKLLYPEDLLSGSGLCGY
jgi:alpha-amylase